LKRRSTTPPVVWQRRTISVTELRLENQSDDLKKKVFLRTKVSLSLSLFSSTLTHTHQVASSSSSSAINAAPAGAANAAAPPLSGLVFETLARDASFRKAGVVDDLIPFDHVQFGRRWDASLPTLVTELTYSKTRVQRATQAAFVKKFHSVFPELQELDWRNFVVAGGAVGHLLVSNDAYDGDVDFFVYGVDKETADLRARALVKALVANRKKLMEDANKRAPPPQQQMMTRGGFGAYAQPSYAASFGGSTSFNLKIIRNANGLSVFIDRRVYQIIFRIYASVSEIIHGFDIGSSAVAFDGTTVFFTSLSKLSYEFMINVVDTTRRSTTYESRLDKYLRRGFQIVLPHFDITKLRTDYHAFGLQEIIMIPHLKVTYTKVSGNQIVVQTFLRFGADNETKAQTTDYQLDDIDEYNLLYINMHHLLSDPTKLYFFWEHEIDLDGKKKAKKAAKKQPKKKRRGATTTTTTTTTTTARTATARTATARTAARTKTTRPSASTRTATATTTATRTATTATRRRIRARAASARAATAAPRRRPRSSRSTTTTSRSTASSPSLRFSRPSPSTSSTTRFAARCSRRSSSRWARSKNTSTCRTWRRSCAASTSRRRTSTPCSTTSSCASARTCSRCSSSTRRSRASSRGSRPTRARSSQARSIRSSPSRRTGTERTTCSASEREPREPDER
jgi:hypothetical protein